MSALSFQPNLSRLQRFLTGKIWVLPVLFLAFQNTHQAHAQSVSSAAKLTSPSKLAELLEGGSLTLSVAVQPGTFTYAWRKSSGVTTLAGSAGMTGASDGAYGVSRMKFPAGLALHHVTYSGGTVSGGSLYVADWGNHTIRRIDLRTREVFTFAGIPGLEGAQNGPAKSATFSKPFGLAVDPAGNVYVSDAGNNSIRKILTTGSVTTLAGSPGLSGSANGTGQAARFNYPTGLAFNAGTLYVADSGNHTIRAVETATGKVTTFAGKAGYPGDANGTGVQALFKNPSGLGFDAGGNLYVADSGNSTIRKVAPNGVVTTHAGSPGKFGYADGVGDLARFSGVGGLGVLGGGTLYVGDNGNHSIRKVTPNGLFGEATIYGGTASSSPGTLGLDADSATMVMKNSLGIAVDSRNNVYFADTDNCTVRRISPYIAVGTSSSIPSVTQPTFTNTSIGAGDTGYYDCLVTGSSGTVRSNALWVLVNTRPYFSLHPSSTTVVTGGSVNLSANAVASGSLSYQWRVGGKDILGATKSSYSFVAKSNSDSGSYECVAYNIAAKTISLPAVVVVNSANAAIVGGSFLLTVAPQTGAVTYTAASPLPPGLVLDKYTGVLKGVPLQSGSYAVTVNTEDESALTKNTLTFNVNVAPVAPGLVGSYQGIVERKKEVNGDMGASFQLTTTADGLFSVKVSSSGTLLASGTSTLHKTGQFATSLGNPNFATAEVLLSKPQETPRLTLSFELDATTNKLTGKLSKGGKDAGVYAWRNAWAEVPGFAAKLKGRYSFKLENTVAAPATPQGYGFGSFEVDYKTGALLLKGRLPDGSAFSVPTFAGQEGEIPVYVPLYKDKGMFTGILKLTKGGLAPLNNTINSPVGLPLLTWKKPKVSAPPLYKSGFDVNLTPSGGVYTAPLNGVNLFEAGDGPAANVKLTFVGINGPQPFHISPDGKLATSTGASFTGVTKPVIDLAAGTFSGTLGASKANFFIQAVGTGSQAKGYGFYLAPDEKAPTSSGKVTFEKTR
jgi:sugar lactone lactonase YvrE